MGLDCCTSDCGTRIERDEDQDTNDFDKCMQDLLSNPLLENCCQVYICVDNSYDALLIRCLALYIVCGVCDTCSYISHDVIVQEWTVLVVGPFLGRLDQEMASYHSAYKWCGCGVPVLYPHDKLIHVTCIVVYSGWILSLEWCYCPAPTGQSPFAFATDTSFPLIQVSP